MMAEDKKEKGNLLNPIEVIRTIWLDNYSPYHVKHYKIRNGEKVVLTAYYMLGCICLITALAVFIAVFIDIILSLLF